MNKYFRSFVSDARAMAEEAGLSWSLPVQADGSVDNAFAWNISELCRAPGPPVFRISDLGFDPKTLAVINLQRAGIARPPLEKLALSENWQDLVKAAVIRQTLTKMNTPGHIYGQVGRSLRVLATCIAAISGCEPWQMTTSDIRMALAIAAQVQKSGTLAQHVAGVVRTVIDGGMLCDGFPVIGGTRAQNPAEPVKRGGILARLQDREGAEKLPDSKALWELVDIVFTKSPRGFVDLLRFAQLRTQIVCGSRVTEVCTIPHDWKRVKEYLSLDGRPAGEAGGISTSLMLRHFAEKQSGQNANSSELVEAFQHIPRDFEQIVLETLGTVARVTAPLRSRLEQQVATGRPFPEFDRMDLVPITDLYTRMTGNPIIMLEGPPDEMLEAYQTGFAPDAIAEINRHQANVLQSDALFSGALVNYWARFRKQPGAPEFRFSDGSVKQGTLTGRRDLYLQIGELEDYMREQMPTKMSDTSPLPLEGGRLLPAYESLFLMPKRMLAEGRIGVCDLTRYFSVGRVTHSDIIYQLDGRENGLFNRYADTDAGRALSMVSHSLRHMQNTALFQAGISDAAITKRFNRTSVVQSYVYDQRTLEQKLDAIDIPAAARSLPDKPKTVLKMIIAGIAKGSIANEFRKIQKDHGDERAFEFLLAEADGLHATPYGHCINGFTQEPCPKHLQCVSGCSHFVNTGLDQNRSNIERLLAKTLRAVDEISKRSGGAGWANQLATAMKHVENLQRILDTPEGQRPFPDGPDLSKPLAVGMALNV